MNVSLISLASPPKNWLAKKTNLDPDPVNRWTSKSTYSADLQIVNFDSIPPPPENPRSLRDAHYRAMEEGKRKFQVILPPRSEAGIAGYGGFVPRKKSENILGISERRANDQAALIRKKL